MAARLNPQHDARTRMKIQTSQLINRLQANALADTEIMTAGQIKSADILLKKVLPDLSSVALGGADGGPLQVVIQRLADDPST